MKTAEEIIAYLEAELAEAIELHKKLREDNKTRSFSYLVKAATIEQLLEDIKK